MRSKEVITLVDYTIEPSSYSDEGIKTPVFEKIYANRYSLSFSEQLRAQTERLRLNGRVEVYSFEYDNQPDIEVNGKTYTILSVTEKGDKTVLTYGERLAK